MASSGGSEPGFRRDRAAWTRDCLAGAATGSARPSVFRRSPEDGPAVLPWHSAELAAAFGATVVEAAILGPRLGIPDRSVRLSLGSLIDLIGGHPPPPIYLRQWPSAAWPEELRRSGERLAAQFALPAAKGLHLWIGASGVYTPAHVDDDDNFIVALQGRKRFIVYPPCRRDPFNSSSAVDAAAGVVFVLQPGDAFFLPAGWMHHVLAWDAGVAMNVWVSRLQFL